MDKDERLRFCTRCLHEWHTRIKTKQVVVCPLCKSPYWNKERMI